MNLFTLISSLVLFGLSALCFLLPYKSGQKRTGWIVGLIFGVLITLTLIGHLEFLVIFIWPIILSIQIVFIVYWIFRFYDKKKLGTISATVLTVIFLLIAMQPWISDWSFNKQDVQKILVYHSFELKDDFEILKNESGGFRDYYQTFTLKISGSDYTRIAEKIKSSKNYVGLFTDLTKQLPMADYNDYDTIDFETNYDFEREYFSKRKMDDGTFHFRFQLSKTEKKLNYIGSNE
jgi:hypothetical protein